MHTGFRVAAGILVTVIVVVAWAAAPVGQGRTYSPPRTPWGDPDLQGAFTNSDKGRGEADSREDHSL